MHPPLPPQMKGEEEGARMGWPRRASLRMCEKVTVVAFSCLTLQQLPFLTDT